jgi:hypothetical protein
MPEHRHFGYRVANEIARFVILAEEQMDSNEPSEAVQWEALDRAILMKVLPKLHGTQADVDRILSDLFAFAVQGDASATHKWTDWDVRHSVLGPIGHAISGGHSAAVAILPQTAAKLWRMLRRLHRQGFTSFME